MVLIAGMFTKSYYTNVDREERTIGRPNQVNVYFVDSSVHQTEGQSVERKADIECLISGKSETVS